MHEAATRARRALGALGALAVLVAPSIVLVGVAAAPAGATGGLRQVATTTYVVDPAGGAVHVTVDLTATNTTPDHRRGNVIEQAYFTGVVLGVLAEATNFNAMSGSGATLSVTSQPAPVSYAQTIDVRFSSNLFYNQTAVVHLRYDLPGGVPRSKSITRVTPAFASFDAWAQGDPGQSSVTIVVPRSFTVDLVGDDTAEHRSATTVSYSATKIANVDTWLVSVSARDDSKLQTKNVDVLGNQIKIRAFPNDPAWGTFVQKRVSTGLPTLLDLIGLPWTAGDRLRITETVTPYLYGYAGWYTRTDDTIEIGDDLDPQVILHEMSHIWFNDLLFTDRWIDEGLAQEYASRAVAESGERLEGPKAVDERAPGAVALDAWSALDLQNQTNEAREAYGYNASWFVVRKLTKEIGLDRMRRVIVAASKQTVPYLGLKNPQAAGGAGSWKRFLDYLDETGGSKTADQIFDAYVVRSGDRDLLASRTRAREEYAALVDAGNGWKVPLEIRLEMTDWAFANARGLMTLATDTIHTRDEIDRVIRPLGLHAPSKLRDDYEDRGLNLTEVKKDASADLAAAKELVKASDAVNGSRSLFEKIGLIGASDHSDLAKARRAFIAGNASDAHAAALAAQRVVADAAQAGKIRGAAVLGSILILALVVWVLRVWFRRRATRKAARGSMAGPGTGPDADPDPDPDPGEDGR